MKRSRIKSRRDRPRRTEHPVRPPDEIEESSNLDDPIHDGFPPHVRSAVEHRSRGNCEARCSPDCLGQASHHHHRKLRRHGDHTEANDLHVCSVCHTAIHGRLAGLRLPPDAVNTYAYEAGLLLRQHDDPTEVRVIAGTP